MSERLFVITGGPSSGKTSLIAALAARGLRTMPEAGRAIIRDQTAVGGGALPWADRAAFADLMLECDMRSHRAASRGIGPVLMDRGVPDVLGYLALCGLPVPAPVKQAAEVFRYNRLVFLAPHWDEIFTQDAQRTQDAAEAKATCHEMQKTYSHLGYTLVTLPHTSIEDRADFVIRHLPA